MWMTRNTKPDIVYIEGIAYEKIGALIPTPNLTIQIIKFTFTHDKFLDQAILSKSTRPEY